jgi:tRNA modification GTPase
MLSLPSDTYDFPETTRQYSDKFLIQRYRFLDDRPGQELYFGELLSPRGNVIDAASAPCSHAHHSYTGENTVEFQCHGSPVVLNEGLRSLFKAGARQALAGEFTKRAFLNHRMDLTQAEAVIDLIDAETPLAAENAAGQ